MSRELLEQLGRAAVDDARGAFEHDVLVQPLLVAPARLDGDRDARVAADVLQLPLVEQRADQELVAVATEPREGHVRRAVGVEGDDVRERIRVDDRAHVRGELHRQDATSATTATISSP